MPRGADGAPQMVNGQEIAGEGRRHDVSFFRHAALLYAHNATISREEPGHFR